MNFDPELSTPRGYWHSSAQYFQAAEAVQAKRSRLMFPTLQLYGQSIELALKAFLLKRGMSLREVEQMRHRLTEILTTCRKRRLGLQVKLDVNDVALVQLLSESYSTHRFRYIVTGPLSVPAVTRIGDITERLLLGLEFYCAGTRWGVRA